METDGPSFEEDYFDQGGRVGVDGVPGRGGWRSPWPEKRDLLYLGILVGRLCRRLSKMESKRGMSWVPGWPRCWRRGLVGLDWARDTWSEWVRYRSSRLKTQVGRLCGGKERVRWRDETRTVLPAPWTPLRPMKKGVLGEVDVWMSRWDKMNGRT